MPKYTADKLQTLKTAVAEIKNFEEFAIQRARLYLEINGHSTGGFQNGNGFSVKVRLLELLDETAEKVFFFQTDEQGNGRTQTVPVPRDFIFEEPSQHELDFLELKRLQEKFKK